MSLPLRNDQEPCLVLFSFHLLLEEEIWSPMLDSELLEKDFLFHWAPQGPSSGLSAMAETHKHL